MEIQIVSPENEARVAERLKGRVLQVWPDVAQSRRDLIAILFGFRLPADVELLLIFDLERPCKRLQKSANPLWRGARTHLRVDSHWSAWCAFYHRCGLDPVWWTPRYACRRQA